LTKAFSRLVRKLKLPVRLHDLQHSHLSHLLSAGIHPKVASERAGHASVAITMDIYSHVLPGMQEEAANKIDAALRVAMDRKPG
jgi:integrase